MSQEKDFAQRQEYEPKATKKSSPPDAPSSNGDDQSLTHKSTYLEAGTLSNLTREHRDYLLKRHGTLELDPVPSADLADPYNWPAWKKNVNLVLVAFSAFMCTFTAAGIIPAFEPIAEELHSSLQKTSYLVSMHIAVLGVAPLFWKPISYRYGRRPVWLISTLLAGVCNVGCAVSHSYGTLSLCRCLVSFFISPATAIGAGVVVETFFKKERGVKTGIWMLLVTLGPPMGPFIMGFVTQNLNYKWIFWIFAIINGAQFVLFFFLGPETRYIRQGVHHKGSAFHQEYLNFSRLDPSPLRLFEFLQPILLYKYASILIPTVAYAIVFNFVSVLMTVEIPQIFIPKFGFNPQQLGLQFLGMIVGSVLGEALAGWLSDKWMNARTKTVGGHLVRPPPEFRLWISHLGFVLVIAGLIVFGVQTENAQSMHWNITPIIGIAIASVGNQIVTTVLVTYAVDSHPEHSSSIGTFVNLVRSTWAFIGPFYFPEMIATLKVSGACGLMAGITAVCSILPILVLQRWGTAWRELRVKNTERGDEVSRGD